MEKLIFKKQTIKGLSSRAIILAAVFVVSLLVNALLGLIGNIVISLICGVAASEAAINKKGTAFKKILPIFSFLAVLEAATFLRLTVFPLGAGSFDPTLIIMGLSFSTFLFIVGWLIGELMIWSFS